MADTPVDKLFARLSAILPAIVVDGLREEYRKDKAEYEKASRERTKERQAAQKQRRREAR